MELKDQLMADIKAAMIAKDSVKLNTLRFLHAAIKQKEIDSRPNPLTADDVMAVLKKLVKQRKESIDQFTNAGRTDLVDQETAELKVMEVYLPAQMSREQIEQVVADVIKETGASSIKDMGTVMKAVQAKTAGSADGKTISEVIKSKLN
ncbi:MAG: GatB/YqeY domain-containing protein [Pseudobdellovibrio sp.]|nr:GatB/YqeY domain-containing protein [Pseudobdellovibrio sp.]